MISYFFFFCLFLLKDVTADCGVISKKDWHGILPVRVSYLPRPVDLVIIQHTVTPTCSTDSGCEELVASIQNNHMDIQNFDDIGHSFIVGGNGNIYEGTGWLHSGSHTIGYNKCSIGISFIGNFNNDQPTEKALQSVKDLLKCGVDSGHLSSNYRLVGHRQLIATESPGRKLYSEIRSWPKYTDEKISPCRT